MDVTPEDNKRKITGKENLTLSLDNSGLYLIKIAARVKDKKQLRGVQDGSLRVEIGGRKFPPASSAVFAGGKLKGLKETIFFILPLNSGKHTVSLTADPEADLESFEVFDLPDNPTLTISVSDQAEDGDRRPWVTFVLVDMSIAFVSPVITYSRRKRDSDDVKIIIDGKTQGNVFRTIKHFLWRFAGSLLSKGSSKTETDTFTLNFSQGLHYIEFWADRMPALRSVSFTGLVTDKLAAEVKHEEAKMIWETANLRALPQSSAGLIAQLKRGDQVSILEKAVKGEWPVDENKVSLLSDRWHKVRYQNKEGFVFSMAVEIKNEDPESIQSLIINEAERLAVDPTLALGIARCESTLFPYQVSSAGAKGLFQITDTLIEDLNNKEKPFYSPVDEPFSIVQNTAAGISYLKWLYGLYQNDKQRTEKTIIAYNAGPGAVPEGIVDLSVYKFQTRRLVQCVLGNGNE